MTTCCGVKPVATSLPQVTFVRTIYIYLYVHIHILISMCMHTLCIHVCVDSLPVYYIMWIHISRITHIYNFDARAFITTEILKCSSPRHMTISLLACTCSGYGPRIRIFLFFFFSPFLLILLHPPLQSYGRISSGCSGIGMHAVHILSRKNSNEETKTRIRTLNNEC